VEFSTIVEVLLLALAVGILSGPVEFPWSAAILAGATFNPLEDWEYETPDVDGAVEVLERATAVGLVSAVKSGGDTIKQEGPVQAGGTAGTTPARLNTEPITGIARSAQKMRVAYRNPTGGTITVDGKIIFTPRSGLRAGVSRGGGGFGGGARRRRPRRR